VRDAEEAFARALKLGAKPHYGEVGPMELEIPAIRGIGGSLIYLVDRYSEGSIYDVDFVPLALPCESASAQQPRSPAGPHGSGGAREHQSGAGLTHIDHITHNVHAGRMDHWARFYERLFGFTELRYFDIHGAKTGLRSRALVSPCGKIRIPINEPTDPKSQIEEYLGAYRGEGIQHIALATDDIYSVVERLRQRGVRFMKTPDAYYDVLQERIPANGEDPERLRRDNILLDGGLGDLLLQIFTQTVIGPIFFEIIQRKGNDGFGDGNFQALFDAIERDQMERGVI
jgi:4-hydroxyphenylpyruvate dioxygenase